MILGLDIGGANLKASNGEEWSQSVPLPLWSDPDQLQPAIETIVESRRPDVIAVTMSGELADCYATKSDGVDQILTAVERAAGDRPIAVWQTAGEFVPVDVAREFWTLTAAANWHAQATWAARCAPSGAAVLLDVGSTTTDIVPLYGGSVDSVGLTDFERLTSGELVYQGLGRTPLVAIRLDTPTGPPMAAELFATTGDAWTVHRGDPTVWSGPTADRRPVNVDASRHRIARQFCSDECELPPGLVDDVAAAVCEQQIADLVAATIRVAGERRPVVIVSGSAQPLATAVVNELRTRGVLSDVVSLARLLSPAAASTACAFAVATLAAERLQLP